MININFEENGDGRGSLTVVVLLKASAVSCIAMSTGWSCCQELDAVRSEAALSGRTETEICLSVFGSSVVGWRRRGFW